MTDMIFWFAVGLVVGWNFLKQPEWIRSLVARAWAWVSGAARGDTDVD